MPAGLPYFAWVDAGETTFGAEHLRWDEAVFSFTLAQEEGDPASLTVVVRRPVNEAGNAIGLLGPGRKIWAWFALDCGPALIKFRGRLIGIPTSIFDELVTLEFVAKPADVVAQKEALADTLRVLPYYDEAVIDKERRKDPDVVLEGYTKIWHYDRETPAIGALTVSDEITGEDGLVEFECATGDILYDGLGLTLSSGPLSRVDVSAEFTWTQQARGTVDLTNYVVSNWPNNINGTIQLNAADWPKRGAGLGDGWEVEDSSAVDLKSFTVLTETSGSTLTVTSPDTPQFVDQGEGGSFGHSTSFTSTRSYFATSNTLIGTGGPIVTDNINVTYAKDGDERIYAASYSRNYSETGTYIVLQEIKPTLVAGYEAERQCTERVSFSLFADVQPILTDPEDGEALRVDDIKSVNLSDPEEGIIIGDPRRRSYIATERGNQSLEHLIARARAHLMKRARAVEITFAPKLSRMPEVTLRKNAFLVEPRVGEALGKIIGYSISLDGNDGRPNCEVRIGCTIGRGGSAVATDGEPTYASVDYVGSDYQQFVGRTVLFDSSVGYQPPDADPNDDGINFMSIIRAEDVIEVPMIVEFGPDEEDAEQPPWTGTAGKTDSEARAEYVKNLITAYQAKATFKLKSMTREFSTDYEVQVTDVKIPTGIDLEAA